jgi:DNA-binding NtrC family response regulator
MLNTGMDPDALVAAAVSAVAHHRIDDLAALAAGPIHAPPQSRDRLRRSLEILLRLITKQASAESQIQAVLAEDPPSPDLHLFLLRALYPPGLARDGDPRLLDRFRQLAAVARHARARAISRRLDWERDYWQHRPVDAYRIAQVAVADEDSDGDLRLEFRGRSFLAAIKAGDFAAAAVERAILEPEADRLATWGLFIRHGMDEMDLCQGHGPDLVRRILAARDGGDPDWAFRVYPWAGIHALLVAGRAEIADEIAGRLRTLDHPIGGVAPPTGRAMGLAGQILIHLYHRQTGLARGLLPEAGLASRDIPGMRRAVEILATRLAWVDRDVVRMRTALTRIDPEERAGDCLLCWALLDLGEGRIQEARHRYEQMRQRLNPERLRLDMQTSFEVDAATAIELAGRPETTAPVRRVSGPVADPDILVGDSPGIRTALHHIGLYAHHDQPVLVTGETGTGKELVARRLHRIGSRSAGPFLALNCASLTDSLAEAELFGHAKGAFTGAITDRPGLLAAAADGSLFLDEINSLPLRLQGLLVRVLETGDYRRIGDHAARHSTARIIAASNEDLALAVAGGRFRADLFFRLARLRVDIPPLRDRRDDILHIARHLLAVIAPRARIALAPDLEAALTTHPWPGNVRELRNVLERAVILARRPERIGLADCPELAPAAADRPAVPAASPGTALIPGNLRARERRRRLLDLFAEHPHLYAVDAVRAVGCAPRTCAADLEALAAAGLVRRVVTSANLGTSYWVRC